MSLHLDRFALFYPLRIVGACFIILTISLYSARFDGFTFYRLLMIGVFVVYPHVLRYLAWQYPHDRLKLEVRAFLLDSFLIGLVVHLIGFTAAPSFALVTVAVVNALAVFGFLQMFLSAVAVLVAIAVSTVFSGLNYRPPVDSVAIDVAASVFLFVYFTFFGYSVYLGNTLLARSRTELREQKAVLEIEKQRSDALLLNLVPIGIAAKMKDAEQIDFTRFDPVTLVAIDFDDFSRRLESEDANEALAHLSHCFKAFDAIAGRHGFEKLKTVGDRYVAVAGVPSAREIDVPSGIEAALEMHQFLNDLREARRAHGKFSLEARTAVHTGSVYGGIVATDKMSFDLWGGAITTLMRLLESAPAGQVVISEAARHAAGERFASTPAGIAGSDMAFYNVQKRAA